MGPHEVMGGAPMGVAPMGGGPTNVCDLAPLEVVSLGEARLGVVVLRLELYGRQLERHLSRRAQRSGKQVTRQSQTLGAGVS